MSRLKYFFVLLILFSLQNGVADEVSRLKLQEKIKSILEKSDSSAQIGIEVVNLQTGELLFEKNASVRMVPASIAKVFTVAAGFDRLGPDFRFETKIFFSGDSLYLKGSGDPSLKAADLEGMALALREKGIRDIKGDLVIDASSFDEIQYAPGWMWDDMPTSWCPPLGACNVNKSRFTLWVEPEKEGPSVRCEGISESVKLCNRVSFGKKTEWLRAERLISLEGHPIEVNGTIAPNAAPQKLKVPVSDPKTHFGSLVREIFNQKGISIRGSVRYAKTPSQAELIITHGSPRLALLAHKMLKKSDNFYSDALFKCLGQGSWQGGSKRVRAFLNERVGIPKDEIILLDGSGISRYNLASPHQFITFLKWIHEKAPYASEFKEALAVAGVDGMIKQPYNSGYYRTMFRGKTGTMTGVATICGYLTTKNRELLAFVIMANGFTSSCREMREKLEKPLLSELISYR